MSLTYIPAAVRQLVFQRAHGCCEYCLVPDAVVFAPHEIDHVVAEKHGGLTEAGNLALSCVLCNKHKGSDLTSIDPETGQIAPLYNPRRDRWAENFGLSEGQIIPRTAVGRVTERLLRLNVAERIQERELLLRANAIRLPE